MQGWLSTDERAPHDSGPAPDIEHLRAKGKAGREAFPMVRKQVEELAWRGAQTARFRILLLPECGPGADLGRRVRRQAELCRTVGRNCRRRAHDDVSVGKTAQLRNWPAGEETIDAAKEGQVPVNVG